MKKMSITTDYIIEKAIKNDKNISCIYKGESMVVKPLTIYHNGKDHVLKAIHNNKVIEMESWDFRLEEDY